MQLQIKVKDENKCQYLFYHCDIHCEWINYQINNANIGLESSVIKNGYSLEFWPTVVTELLIKKLIYSKFTKKFTEEKLFKCAKLLQSNDKNSINLGQSLLFRGGIEENYIRFMKIYKNTA